VSSKNHEKQGSLQPPDHGGALMRKLLAWLVSPIVLYGLFLLVYAAFFEERLPIWPEFFIPLLVLVPTSLYLILERPP